MIVAIRVLFFLPFALSALLVLLPLGAVIALLRGDAKAAVIAWARKYRAWLTTTNRWIAHYILGAPSGYTMSGYSWKLEQAGKPWGEVWRPKIDALFLWAIRQLDHCRKAHDKDAEFINLRAQ